MKYQDFVIKDGNFIGNFEEMYKTFDDPWEQSTREANSREKKIGLEILKNNNYKNVMELGCGLGYYTNQIFGITGNCIGVDISETAVKKASVLYPNCKFIASDILNENLYKNLDCVMMIEITWYVLEKLSRFKELISKNKGMGFFHALNTYPKGIQKYGTEYFTNNEEIISFFSDIIDIEEYGVFSKKQYNNCERTYFYGKVKG